MTQCCLIGGGGFIGTHLANLLTTEGINVSVVDQKPSPSSLLSQKVNYYSGDFGNPGFCEQFLDRSDWVVHLAYSTIPKTSFENPIEDIQENLPPSIRLFEVVRKLPIKRFLYISSGGTVYGIPTASQLSESHPTNPISPYGITKLALEKYALLYHHLYNLPIMIARPSNAYGIGQVPFGGQGIISTAMGAALSARPIQVFGNLDTIRDYIYITDLVQGLMKILACGKVGEIYNVGTGLGRSLKEVLSQVEVLVQRDGFKMLYEIMPSRGFDVTSNVLDSKKLNVATTWLPQVTFSDGLCHTWSWLRQLHGKGNFSLTGHRLDTNSKPPCHTNDTSKVK